MATTYIPPKQGIFGQMFDVAFLLGLVFVALFLPIWLGVAVPSRVEKLPPGVTYTTAADGTRSWQGLTWEKLGQNPTEQAQWQKLGDSMSDAAAIITMPFDYEIDFSGVLLTVVIIGGYFAFMLVMSEKEYKQVIAEKFD